MNVRDALQGLGIYLAAAGPAGLARAVEGKLLNRVRPVRITRSDCEHPFELRIPTSDVSTCWQVFVNGEYDFDVRSPPAVIVDAGANIGLASILFANRFPQARIIAIEAERNNFELLKKNVAPYSRITPLHAALWNHNGSVDVMDPGLGNWGFMTGTHAAPGEQGMAARHAVPSFTVDRLMADHSIDRIDILKMDIEGAELEVLADASAWIDRVDGLIVELHEHMKPGCIASYESVAAGFPAAWAKGENYYLSRERCLAPRRVSPG